MSDQPTAGSTASTPERAMQIRVETTLGPVIAWPRQTPLRVTSPDLGYVDGIRAWEPLTIRGHSYALELRFDRHPDGTWTRHTQIGDFYTWIKRVNAAGHTTGGTVTIRTAPTVIDAIHAAIPDALAEHLTPLIRWQADTANLDVDVTEASHAVTLARKALRDAEDHLNAARLLRAVYGEHPPTI